MKKLHTIIMLILLFISGCGFKNSDNPQATIPQNTNDYDLSSLPKANKFIAENIIMYDYQISPERSTSTVMLKNNSKYYLNNIYLGIRKKDSYELLGYFDGKISLRPNTSTMDTFNYDSYEPFDYNQVEICIVDLSDKIFDGGEQEIKNLISENERENIIYATDLEVKFKRRVNEKVTVSIKNKTDRNLELYGTKILLYSPSEHLCYAYGDIDKISIAPNQSEKYSANVYSNHLTRNSVAIFTGADMSFEDWM